MGMRTDPANAFEQVQVLNPVSALCSFFDSSMSVAQTHTGGCNDFAIHGELKMTWFFQRRMLRTDGDNKRVPADYPFVGQFIGVTTLDGFSLLDGKIRSKRIYVFRPIIGNKQTVTAFCTSDFEAEHFMQFSFKERCGRDNVFNGRQSRTTCARQTNPKGGDCRAIAEVVERLHLTGIRPEVQTRDRGKIAPMCIV